MTLRNIGTLLAHLFSAFALSVIRGAGLLLGALAMWGYLGGHP